MKKLYDENFKYTTDAVILHTEVSENLHEIFSRFVKAGYNPREISHIVQGVITEFELEAILNKENK